MINSFIKGFGKKTPREVEAFLPEGKFFRWDIVVSILGQLAEINPEIEQVAGIIIDDRGIEVKVTPLDERNSR